MKKNVTLKRSLVWFSKLVFVAIIAISAHFPSFSQILINEGFNTITAAAPIPFGWAQQNRSVPVGSSAWFQGTPATFPAFNGAPNSYVAANFQNVGGANTISNWLFTPTIAIKNGDQLTFWTRKTPLDPTPANNYPDRLQVRMSTNGSSVNVGTTNVSVGDYTTLLLDINPLLTISDYPFVWTLQTVTITGVPTPVTGRIAFRYFVTNGGSGDNSDYIGIDQVTYDGTPCTNTPAAAPIVVASASTVCSGTAVTLTPNGALNNSTIYRYYTGSCGGTLVGSGNSITVNPSVTTTYFVRGEGGCGTTASGACGQVTINVTSCTCITPGAAEICEGAIQSLQVTLPPTQTFTSTTTVLIPGVGTSGPGNPYPSTLVVSGVPLGAIVRSVTINGITHTWPNDIDIALVSPTNVPVIIMSDVAGISSITNRSYTFDDAATSQMPDATTASGTTWRPSNLEFPDAFVAPGPGTLNQPNPLLSSFTGDMNGTWRLFGVDDVGGDVGRISGFSITFSVLPTATWTGAPGTIFSNAAGTIPYVAGTQANIVYVKPTATSTYTATIAAGACAGANNVVVTVKSKPVVTLDKTSGCGPLTVTASGATNYNWTPAGGLNTTSGPVVTANPLTTTTYSVIGLSPNGCFSNPVSVLVNAAPSASVISAITPGATFQINEGFDVVPPPSWSVKNQSSPLGASAWFQGNPAIPSFDGAPNSYTGANFQNTTSNGTISTWLFTPTVPIKNGDVVSFYTIAAPQFATRGERLQLRMSLNGASTDVGTTALSVGDFTTTVLEINPLALPGSANYPEVWTRYQATITGVTGTVNGKFALRYFILDGGNPGTSGQYIGVDRFQYGTPPTGITCANTVSNIKVDVTGGVGPYTLVYSDGTTNTTFNSYVSGTNITVSPAVTTTYSIVSVTGANGCLGSGNTGAAIITVTPVATITTQPTNRSICVGANTSFTVVPNTTNGTTYQWQLNTVLAPGAPVWTNITNGGVYSGATTATLNVTGATSAMLGYSYRVLVNGFCGGNLTSTAATLTVVTPAGGTVTLANQTVCEGSNATITANITGLTGGPGFTHQFQVSTNGGVTFTNIANGGVYSGATTPSLLITGVPNSFNNYQFRDSVNTVNGCGFIRSTVATLTVNPKPIVTISAAPVRNLFPGLTTTLTAAVSPNPTGAAYQWFRNGTAVAGATTNRLVVGIDGVGTYTIRVTDANGCIAAAGASTPGSIVIGDSANFTKLFIYPSPNNGRFQVRYFNDVANNGLNPGIINVYDAKGSRVFSRNYTVGGGFQAMNVDLGASHGSGIYRVDLLTSTGERIKTGTVIIF